MSEPSHFMAKYIIYWHLGVGLIRINLIKFNSDSVESGFLTFFKIFSLIYNVWRHMSKFCSFCKTINIEILFVVYYLLSDVIIYLNRTALLLSNKILNGYQKKKLKVSF